MTEENILPAGFRDVQIKKGVPYFAPKFMISNEETDNFDFKFTFFEALGECDNCTDGKIWKEFDLTFLKDVLLSNEKVETSILMIHCFLDEVMWHILSSVLFKFYDQKKLNDLEKSLKGFETRRKMLSASGLIEKTSGMVHALNEARNEISHNHHNKDDMRCFLSQNEFYKSLNSEPVFGGRKNSYEIAFYGISNEKMNLLLFLHDFMEDVFENWKKNYLRK